MLGHMVTQFSATDHNLLHHILVYANNSQALNPIRSW